MYFFTALLTLEKHRDGLPYSAGDDIDQLGQGSRCDDLPPHNLRPVPVFYGHAIAMIAAVMRDIALHVFRRSLAGGSFSTRDDGDESRETKFTISFLVNGSCPSVGKKAISSETRPSKRFQPVPPSLDL